jgi:hypothetical protein
MGKGEGKGRVEAGAGVSRLMLRRYHWIEKEYFPVW